MNSEQQRLEKVLQYFLKNHCDDPINDTRFDCAVIDTIQALQKQFADNFAGEQAKHKKEAKRIRKILANLGDTFKDNRIVRNILRQRIEQEESRAEGIMK